MPRSRGSTGGRAPSRPTAAPARQAPPTQQQQRPHSTAAPMQQQQSPAQAQGQSSGLFGQMASTAAGVAVGSSIGHAIGGFFGGGSPSPAEQQQTQSQPYNTQFQDTGAQQSTNSQYGGGSCEVDAKNFTQCLDQNGGNMQICGWYLEQLKACQAASARY